jgi:hypothetical protein
MQSLALNVPDFLTKPGSTSTAKNHGTTLIELGLPSLNAPEWDEVSPKIFVLHIRATVDLFIDCLEARDISDETLLVMRRQMDASRPDRATCASWLYELEHITHEYCPTGEFFRSNPDLKRALYIALVLMVRSGW